MEAGDHSSPPLNVPTAETNEVLLHASPRSIPGTSTSYNHSFNSQMSYEGGDGHDNESGFLDTQQFLSYRSTPRQNSDALSTASTDVDVEIQALPELEPQNSPRQFNSADIMSQVGSFMSSYPGTHLPLSLPEELHGPLPVFSGQHVASPASSNLSDFMDVDFNGGTAREASPRGAISLGELRRAATDPTMKTMVRNHGAVSRKRTSGNWDDHFSANNNVPRKRNMSDISPTDIDLNSGLFSSSPLHLRGGNILGSTNLVASPQQDRETEALGMLNGPSAPNMRRHLNQPYLFDIPIEILTMILEFAILPPEKYRRPSKGKSILAPDLISMADEMNIPIEGGNDPDQDLNLQEKENLSKRFRMYPAKTLFRLALTSKKLNELLMHDEHMDKNLWRSAARICWPELPNELKDVQGRRPENQTSWQNLFAVFTRGENGAVNYRKKRSSDRSPYDEEEVFGHRGKGGVEGFGTKRGCKPVIFWRNYKLIREANLFASHKLVLLCTQPGPDPFNAVMNRETGSFLLSLTLLNGGVFVNIDSKGNFSGKYVLPKWMKRSTMGWLPGDILEDEGDRNALVKVGIPALGVPLRYNEEGDPEVQELLRWNLSCIPTFQLDEFSKVAKCAREDKALVLTLFTDDGLMRGLVDPRESNTIYCVDLVEDLGAPGSQRTVLKWEKRFTHPSQSNESEPQEEDAEPSDAPKPSPAYLVSNFKLTKSWAVILVRWNSSTELSAEILDDQRQFHILSLETGETLKVLQFPDFSWDHRHDDMSDRYNEIRLQKLKALYNIKGATHRTTRVHDDQFLVTEDESSLLDALSGRIICGSHDYCNWVWELNSNDDKNPDIVLDDFYWEPDSSSPSDSDTEMPETHHLKKQKWDTETERAGWWVDTPNQVLDFWHGLSKTFDGKHFAACRAGRMFIWNLNELNTVEGFSCAPIAYPTMSTRGPIYKFPATAESWPSKDMPSSSGKGKSKAEKLPVTTRNRLLQRTRSLLSEDRYLGKLRSEKLSHSVRTWFEWKGRVPEQGLWMMFEDGLVVYLDREDILDACGIGARRSWRFKRDDFLSIDEEDSDSDSDSNDEGNVVMADNEIYNDEFNSEERTIQVAIARSFEENDSCGAGPSTAMNWSQFW